MTSLFVQAMETSEYNVAEPQRDTTADCPTATGQTERAEKIHFQIEDLNQCWVALRKSMEANEVNLVEPNTIAIHPTTTKQMEAAEKILMQIDDFDKRWVALRKVMQKHVQTLGSTLEVQCYHRDVDQIKDKIIEKERMVNSKDFGHNLITIQRLRSKKLIKEIDVIREEVKELGDTAQRLMLTHQDQAQRISNHEAEIKNRCEDLIKKTSQQRYVLLDYCDLQYLLCNFRDQFEWINDMMALMSSDKLARDITSAKLMLRRHQEYKMDIDAQAANFQSFKMFGRRLLQNCHYASGEVRTKLDEVAAARKNLKIAWVNRHTKLNQCLEHNRAKLRSVPSMQQHIDCGFLPCGIVLGPLKADTKKSRKVFRRHSTRYSSIGAISASSANEVSSGCKREWHRAAPSRKQHNGAMIASDFRELAVGTEDGEYSKEEDKPTPKRLKLKYENSIHVRNLLELKTNEDDKMQLQLCLDYLQTIMQRRDTNGFFAFTVTDNIAPGYSSIISHPMDFSSVKAKIDDGAYGNVAEFEVESCHHYSDESSYEDVVSCDHCHRSAVCHLKWWANFNLWFNANWGSVSV